MSLTDKVIKNTFYHVFAQLLSFISPLILTPLIISKIGNVQFGIYALVLGFVGIFGLLDISISASFIKFISEYYNREEYDDLNRTINTGFLFYIVFSLLLTLLGFLFTKRIVSLIHVPGELIDTAQYALRISLVTFFITNSFGIFGSVLVSLQKMYVTSIINTVMSLFNFAGIVALLNMGFGLIEILWIQLITFSINVIITYVLARRELHEMRIGYAWFSRKALRNMGGFGVQMQISKLASFASDKYDEFLLGFFSVLSNVTIFNIGNRMIRFGKFFTSQFIVQVAPVAAELNARGEVDKLDILFSDITKYLVLLTAPVFVFTFAFSDVIINAWMGSGYELSAYVIRILVSGQLINISLSAPGNSITPNIGIPRYQMNEGLIHLMINVVLSWFLIKYYGIIGAAYGNTIATLVASGYVFIVSMRHFKKQYSEIFSHIILKPILVSVACTTVLYLIYKVFLADTYFVKIHNRLGNLSILAVAGVLYLLLYILLIANLNYINERDRHLMTKLICRIIPLKYLKRYGES